MSQKQPLQSFLTNIIRCKYGDGVWLVSALSAKTLAIYKNFYGGYIILRVLVTYFCLYSRL